MPPPARLERSTISPSCAFRASRMPTLVVAGCANEVVEDMVRRFEVNERTGITREAWGVNRLGPVQDCPMFTTVFMYKRAPRDSVSPQTIILQCSREKISDAPIHITTPLVLLHYNN